MKLKREARTLKQKALSSLRRGLSSFNSFEDDGRVTSVLLHFQHACEMLLKAALIQKSVKIFDLSGRTFSLEKCANLAKQNCGITDGEAGLMRALPVLAVANLSSKRNVSRYELTVCELACRCCMRRWVKKRVSTPAKLGAAIMACAPNAARVARGRGP